MRRAARTDANHAAIREAMRDEGLSVADTSAVGGGFPDLVASYGGDNGRCILVEVKDGAKVKSARKLTPAQVRFHAAWRGPIVVIESVEQARTFARGMREGV